MSFLDLIKQGICLDVFFHEAADEYVFIFNRGNDRLKLHFKKHEIEDHTPQEVEDFVCRTAARVLDIHVEDPTTAIKDSLWEEIGRVQSLIYLMVMVPWNQSIVEIIQHDLDQAVKAFCGNNLELMAKFRDILRKHTAACWLGKSPNE